MSVSEQPHVWLQSNDPIPYMLEVAGKLHIGDKELLLAHLLSAHSLGMAEEVDPIHLYTIGKSGKGKGHTANTILRLFPRDMVVPLASFSSKAFFYAKKEELDNKIIHCPEVTVNNKDEEKLGLLRLLTDSPSNTLRPEHWTIDDKRQKRELKLEGKIVFWFNSVTPIEDDQVKNRVILGNPDESGGQDNLVNEQQMRIHGLLEEPVNDTEIQFCQELNKAILGEKELNVIIPFAQFIRPPNTANRRFYPIFLSLIKAITKMRMNQREEVTKVGNGKSIPALLATPEDIEHGIWVFHKLFPTTSAQISKQALDLLEFLPNNPPGLTKEELADLAHISADWCYRKCRELYVGGFVQSEAENRKMRYWKDDSGQARLKSEIRVEWENIGEKELLEVFEKISVAIKDKETVQQYCKKYAHFQYNKPKWIEDEETRIAKALEASNSVTKVKPSSTEKPVEWQTLNPEVSYV